MGGGPSASARTAHQPRRGRRALQLLCIDLSTNDGHQSVDGVRLAISMEERHYAYRDLHVNLYIGKLSTMDFVLLPEKASSGVVKTSKFAVYQLPTASTIGDEIDSETDSDAEAVDNPIEISEEELQSLYGRVFAEFPSSMALKASLEERKASTDPSMKASSMIYGELVDLSAMYHVFSVALESGEWSFDEDSDIQPLSFCDIGHGTGRVTIGAALFSLSQQHKHITEKKSVRVFQPCMGVELMDSLYDISKEVQSLYLGEVHRLEATAHSHLYPTVSFARGSLLDLSILDWTACNFVFANSTCFDEVLMEDIGERARQMRPGSIMITMSKLLPTTAGFTVVEEIREKTSW